MSSLSQTSGATGSGMDTERCIGCGVVFAVSAELHEVDGCSYEPDFGLCDHCWLWATLKPATRCVEVDIAAID